MINKKANVSNSIDMYFPSPLNYSKKYKVIESNNYNNVFWGL